MIDSNFVCPLTKEKADFGWCGVMLDVVTGFAPKTCVPDNYIQDENFKEICKNCESYNKMIELNS